MAWFFNKGERDSGTAASAIDKQILESVIAASADAVIVYDTDFRVNVFNQAAEALFGIPRTEIIGRQFSLEQASQTSSKLLANVMFPSLAPTVIRQSQEGAYPQVIDLKLDDPYYEVRIVLNRIMDAQGAIIGFLKIVHDQTREQELFHAQQDFISVAAHQLRTPATAVNWAFESLAKDQSLVKEAQDLVAIGHAAGKNLMKIINDILNIAQIEGGRFGYQFQQVDLVDFFDKILIEAEPIAKEYKVNVYFDRPQEAIPVTIDVVRLGMAVSNLIDNAIKYNVAGGSVTLLIHRLPNEPFVQIDIKDTGIGIPPQDINKLFTKFFRGANIKKFSIEGSGLGLYITRNVIQRHGGTISAESVPDRGTTIHFTLPTDPKLIPVR